MKRSRQKKQLKSLNPRRSPKGDKNKSVPAKRLDPLTAVLAFIALLLLILIFLMIGRKPAGRLLPVPETASGPNSPESKGKNIPAVFCACKRRRQHRNKGCTPAAS